MCLEKAKDYGKSKDLYDEIIATKESIKATAPKRKRKATQIWKEFEKSYLMDLNVSLFIQHTLFSCNHAYYACNRIARKFGGELNLVVWRSHFTTAKLKSAKISSMCMCVWQYRTEPPN